MKKKYFSGFFIVFTILNLFLFNITYSISTISPLPRNAFLQFGDNLKEVKILQIILNSNYETEIIDQGPGSPGNENWYFGKMTEDALKKFQKINQLEITGRIDFKTWKKLNDYVNSQYQINQNTETETTSTNNNIKNLDEVAKENKKDFIEATKIEEKAKTEKKEILKQENKTFIQNLLDKYTGFFTSKNNSQNPNNTSNATTTTILDIYSNGYSNKTPYYNPETGLYSSNPNNANQNQNFNPFLGQPSQQQQPNFLTNLMQGAGLSPQGAISMKDGIFNGQPAGSIANSCKFIPGEDGWLTGSASNFGHNDNTPGANCTAAMQGYSPTGRINICDASVCLVSLPVAVQKYYFGDLPTAARYQKIAGTPIEIINTKNGRCTVAPLWETGPGPNEGGCWNQGKGGGIDLTDCVKTTLGAAKGDNFAAKFRPVKAGAKGCEGYNYTPVPNVIKR